MWQNDSFAWTLDITYLQSIILDCLNLYPFALNAIENCQNCHVIRISFDSLLVMNLGFILQSSGRYALYTCWLQLRCGLSSKSNLMIPDIHINDLFEPNHKVTKCNVWTWLQKINIRHLKHSWLLCLHLTSLHWRHVLFLTLNLNNLLQFEL